MAVTHTVGFDEAREEIHIRKIGLHDLRTALAQGWEDFLAKRGDMVFAGIIYAAMMLLAGLYAQNRSILPLIFPLLAGAILLGPAFATGFYELARRRELRLDTRWRHFFDVARSPAAPAIIALTSIVFLLFALWVCAAWLIYLATLGSSGSSAPGSISALLHAVLTTSKGWEMAIIGNLVGLGFAILTLAISAVSFPMLVDRSVPLATAVHTSFRVARANPVTLAVWGLIVVGLLVLGALPAFVGLAVVLPVLGYATWHLYTRAVVR